MMTDRQLSMFPIENSLCCIDCLVKKKKLLLHRKMSEMRYVTFIYGVGRKGYKKLQEKIGNVIFNMLKHTENTLKLHC